MHTTRTVHIHRPQPRPLNRRCWTFRFVPTQSTLLPHYLYVKYHGTSFCCFAQSKVTYFFLSRKSLFNHSNQIILFFYDFCVFFLVLLKLFCYSFYRSEICVYFLVARKKTVFPFIQSNLSQIVQNMNFYGIPKIYDTFGSIETTIEKRYSFRISFTKLQRVSDNQFFVGMIIYFFFSRWFC